MKSMINCIFLILLFSGSREETYKDGIIRDNITIPSSEIEMETYRGVVRELHILHPTFRNKVIMLLYECKKQGIDLLVVETYRSPERQDSLKRKRFSRLSGGCSKHQHFLAVDVVPIVNGKAIWHNKKLWRRIEKVANSQGLITGAGWKKLYDPGHIEYPCSLDEISSIPLSDTVLIPDITWK